MTVLDMKEKSQYNPTFLFLHLSFFRLEQMGKTISLELCHQKVILVFMTPQTKSIWIMRSETDQF